MKTASSLIGKKVKVSRYNDNENYDQFRNKTLIITHAERDGVGYDNSVYPQLLCSFKDLQGNEIPYSLYEYEIEIL